MNIVLLSGAVKNAGDYLITKRCRELISYCYPNCHIIILVRNNPLTDEQIRIINKANIVIIGGGPYYKWDIYPNAIPLVKNLDCIKVPIAMIGGGWYGSTVNSSEVLRYQFSDLSRCLLNRVVSDTKVLGCRDYYAVRVLRANGYHSELMTGCPAWYDITNLGKEPKRLCDIKKIAVSDPADIIHYGDQSYNLVTYLRKRFNDAEIIYLFHRGVTQDYFTDKNTYEHIQNFKNKLSQLGIVCYDIAYSDQGFSYYDDCDLHIGHRVHAHIYNLSQRHWSILLEEDSRGAGVDEALGLWTIKAYARKKDNSSPFWVKCYNKLFDYTRANDNCIDEIDFYIGYLLQSDGKIFDNAFSSMKSYFEAMIWHLKSLEKYV